MEDPKWFIYIKTNTISNWYNLQCREAVSLPA